MNIIKGNENAPILLKLIENNMTLTPTTRKMLSHAIVNYFFSIGKNMNMNDFKSIAEMIENVFDDKAVSILSYLIIYTCDIIPTFFSVITGTISLKNLKSFSQNS